LFFDPNPYVFCDRDGKRGGKGKKKKEKEKRGEIKRTKFLLCNAPECKFLWIHLSSFSIQFGQRVFARHAGPGAVTSGANTVFEIRALIEVELSLLQSKVRNFAKADLEDGVDVAEGLDFLLIEFSADFFLLEED
jgi:hypothetical protein